MDQEQELKIKRLKIYLAPLLPINPSLIDNMNKELINVNRSQAFVGLDDVHREVFSYILLKKGKQIGKKPTYKIVTLDDLVCQHFANEALAPICLPDVLFILHTSGYTNNPIYGPVFNKVTEERGAVGKPTYFFFKGTQMKLGTLNIVDTCEVVRCDGVKKVEVKTVQPTFKPIIKPVEPSIKQVVETEEDDEEEVFKKPYRYDKKKYRRVDNNNDGDDEDPGKGSIPTGTDGSRGLLIW